MIGIIIVTYNSEAHIERCLASLTEITRPYECVVIDNGSKDATLEIIRRCPNVEVISVQSNLGFGRANNIGMRLALKRCWDYIALVNHDVYDYARAIKRAIDNYKSAVDVGIISALHYSAEPNVLDYKFSKNLLSESAYLRYFRKRNLFHKDDFIDVKFVNAAFWVLSREALMKVGGFSPVFDHYGEDVEYTKRMQGFGLKIRVLLDIGIVHNRPQENHLQENIQRRLLDYKARMHIYVLECNKIRVFLTPKLLFKMVMWSIQEKSMMSGGWIFLHLVKTLVQKHTLYKTHIRELKESENMPLFLSES